jgi:hypothetical protein
MSKPKRLALILEARASINWGPLRPISYWMVILGSTRSPSTLIWATQRQV